MVSSHVFICIPSWPMMLNVFHVVICHPYILFGEVSADVLPIYKLDGLASHC